MTETGYLEGRPEGFRDAGDSLFLDFSGGSMGVHCTAVSCTFIFYAASYMVIIVHNKKFFSSYYSWENYKR